MKSWITLYDVCRIWKRVAGNIPCSFVMYKWLSKKNGRRYEDHYYKDPRKLGKWMKNVKIKLPADPGMRLPNSYDTTFLLTKHNYEVFLSEIKKDNLTQDEEAYIAYQILREQEAE